MRAALNVGPGVNASLARPGTDDKSINTMHTLIILPRSGFIYNKLIYTFMVFSDYYTQNTRQCIFKYIARTII